MTMYIRQQSLRSSVEVTGQPFVCSWPGLTAARYVSGGPFRVPVLGHRGDWGRGAPGGLGSGNGASCHRGSGHTWPGH
jgi:hypothetical protein